MGRPPLSPGTCVVELACYPRWPSDGPFICSQSNGATEGNGEDQPLRAGREPGTRTCWQTEGAPFFAFAPEIRRVIYTTDALENVHARLRKIIKPEAMFRAMRRPRSSSGAR
jgi:hypothetical protein